MIDQFLKYLLVEKRYSTHTHEAYKRDLGQFLTFLKAIYPGTTLSSVQHFHIRAWQVDLVTNKVTPRSINRKLSSLRSFYKFGIRKGYFKSNPLLKIIPPKTPKNSQLLFQITNWNRCWIMNRSIINYHFPSSEIILL